MAALQDAMKRKHERSRHNCKLTAQQESHARWLRSRGFTYAEIGQYFGISENGARAIVLRQPGSEGL